MRYAAGNHWGREPRSEDFQGYRAAHRVVMPSVVRGTTRYTNNRAEVSIDG